MKGLTAAVIYCLPVRLPLGNLPFNSSTAASPSFSKGSAGRNDPLYGCSSFNQGVAATLARLWATANCVLMPTEED